MAHSSFNNNPCFSLQDSPPPTDDELQQFLDYMEAGVLNEERLEYEERRRLEQEQVGRWNFVARTCR